MAGTVGLQRMFRPGSLMSQALQCRQFCAFTCSRVGALKGAGVSEQEVAGLVVLVVGPGAVQRGLVLLLLLLLAMKGSTPTTEVLRALGLFCFIPHNEQSGQRAQPEQLPSCI
ncbi:hypothetical protein TSOC_000825 [Tetrabaena socialis]|uniref:Uncharacterized protein n=1 Tax=Tetrabaena socialis TaxID=47790 RepID=A0A2J8AIA4_9CHLO|nr:hypothetical protein TSOC_000825 [Tetrabaena socialis]|eukprot:PNH12241.1 hypothetical protein TSOC_000825 [Tetrabaena socialis]